MIFNTLTLHNFMSYADERLDLASIGVACLTGQNGAGKSALLDAVTWVLWEGGRASSDELIRLGEREMWVEMTFELDGKTYRVRRNRQLARGKGSSRGTLDLQVMTQTEGGGKWASLTGATMRETQRRLNEITRMDLDTFTNSVYLRQGKADEFTTKPPSERKQVLCEILGLSYFDRLRESARERARELKGRAEIIQGSLADLPGIKERQSSTEEELAETVARLSECQEKLAFYEGSLRETEAELASLESTRQMMASSSARLAELDADIEGLRQRQADTAARLAEANDLIETQGELEAACQRFAALKSAVEKLDLALIELTDLNAEKIELKSSLASLRSRLEMEMENSERILAEKRSQASALAREVSEKDKIERDYARFRELVRQESDESKKQEDFIRLNRRAQDLAALVSEARIRLEAELQQKEKALAELSSILATADSASTEEAELKASADALDRVEIEFQHVEDAGLRLRDEIKALEAKISENKTRQKENMARVGELTEHSQSSICPLCSSPIVDRAAVIDRYMQENQALAAEVSAMETAISSRQDEIESLRARYKELRSLLDGRKELDLRIGRFNEKMAAFSRASQSSDSLAAELERIRARLSRQDFAHVERESLVSVKAELHKLDFDPVTFASLQSQIRSMRYVEGRFHQLKKDLAELKKIEAEIPDIEQKKAALADTIASESYGREIRDRLSNLLAKIEALAYDRAEHQSLKVELASLMPCAERLAEMKAARSALPALESELESIASSAASKQVQRDRLRCDLGQMQEAVDRAPALEERAASLMPEVLSLRARQDELRSQAAVLADRQREIEKAISGLGERSKELEATLSEMDDYSYLAEAFGKKGIQALIIENAIPEIENEANRILSRVSDNRMHIALATQFKTKAGGMAETLDLLIGDDLGTRNYELYSGGEAFKVDFAVRIALSRLLARRAGAKLETLIIDEGFGSQDTDSRERMVQTINSIRSDFRRILVITHIAEIRDMFPAQIQVVKRNGVSSVLVRA